MNRINKLLTSQQKSNNGVAISIKNYNINRSVNDIMPLKPVSKILGWRGIDSEEQGITEAKWSPEK